MATFTIRPSNAEKEVFRIKLTAASLLALKIRPGDLCTLHLINDETDKSVTRTAIAWENSGGGMKDGIVQTSRVLQELYGLKLGDRINIQRSAVRLQDAVRIHLRPMGDTLSREEQAMWSLVASATIPPKHDVLVPSQKLCIEVGDQKKEFEVLDIGGPIGRVTRTTTFSFEEDISCGQGPPIDFQLNLDGIGGIPDAKRQIQSFVKHLLNPRARLAWSKFPVKHGLLLYGAKGTGKSMLQEFIAKSGWSIVTWWTPGTKVSSNKSPSLVIIDFDNLSEKSRHISEMVALFDEVKNTPCLVLGSVRHPNDVPEQLRSERRFAREVELPIPDAALRLDILRSLRAPDTQPSDEQLAEIASRTHGFVGADLVRLLDEIWSNAVDREDNELVNGSTPHQAEEQVAPMLIRGDIEYAISQVRPSALQEIFLEKPNVHWADIGGQHDIKRQLQDAVENPLKRPDRMKMLGLQPIKGVLLYGPPGCSKTLTVKALATEAGINFLAVKGAELISMYVGESEKATREVFRKARQASPSIIFFDEIDAIASRGRSGSDLNVLTTLLNEMDGFEELKNVLVVAATNKPQSIDPALLRPGRFDKVVYIGPPDYQTRKEIFDKRFQNISVELEVKAQTEQYAKMTDGFSGAEVVAICQNAGGSALEFGRDVITVGDVLQAIHSTPKSITKDMLQEYEQWNASRL